MSVEDWLNSAIQDPAQDPATGAPPPAASAGPAPSPSQPPPSQPSPSQPLRSQPSPPRPAPSQPALSQQSLPSQETQEVSEIHQRLDEIAHQIDQISRASDRGRPPMARQLNDAIARQDHRPDANHEPRPGQGPRLDDSHAPAAAPRSLSAASATPPDAPASAFDRAVAEILARQGELDRDLPSATSSATDWAGVERRLSKIDDHLEALRSPAQLEQAAAGLRGELSDIRKAITEAMPRQAIESVETEIRQLARRIDDNRHDGDPQALAGIETALGEIRESLKSLTPAEQLAGFDEAIRGLNTRLDSIVRATDDPASLGQLEGTIAALRTVVANVASNEALAQLRDDVHALSEKVDQLAQGGGYGETFIALEQRIATLTTALETRAPAAAEPLYSEQLEGAMRTLSERLDRIPVGNDSPSALAHLEQRVVQLLERLEASADHRASDLGRVEEGLQDVLRHLERQQSQFAAAPAAGSDSLAEGLRRELSDLRHSQVESDRHTQDSLEAMHNTLGHVVDRLAMIESDLRAARAAPAPRPAPPPRPDLPNPAQARSATPEDDFTPPPPQAPAEPPPEIRAPDAAPPKPAEAADHPVAPIRADLPPDHPLEPGTLPPGRMTPSERVAASEEALREIAPAAPEPGNASSFIAAARRAAQAASALPKPPKLSRAASLNDSIRAAAKSAPPGSRIRTLLVGAGVVVLVLGSFKLAMTYLDGGSSSAPQPFAQQSAPDLTATPDDDGDAADAPSLPSMTSPTPIDRQSFNSGATDAPTDSDAAAADRPAGTDAAAAAPNAASPAEVTGSIPASPRETQPPPAGRGTVQIPPSERLPDAIGGPALRNSALKGDAAAAHEVARRYAEGKGVVADLNEAAKWYARAAQGGIVPAMFRLGTFYEKGLGVTKDVATARRYYLMAAEHGSAKAMHNLAVLDADGGGHGANYRSAAQWFRNAAERGVADSQFNLGILYARGIGVGQNLSESFKWFSLAAAQGDIDAGRKRDDIAKRLDAQSLAAAKLAVQNFTPVKQPDDAVNVPAPAGGWDAPAQAGAGKTSASRNPAAAHRRTARGRTARAAR